jgi:FkbM family methyltransferase
VSVFEGLRAHYRILGPHGVLLVTKCRVTARPIDILVRADGIAHPVRLRLRTTDLALFEEIIQHNEYAMDLPAEPTVIVDAGANIGLASVYFANVFPAARIFAIEPEHANFELLRINAAPYENITPICAALWKDSAALVMTNPQSGYWGFQIQERSHENHDDPTVPGVTMDDLISTYRLASIDLLKVDVEGAEKEIFEHSSGWIDHVDGIAIETHDRLKEGCHDSVLAAAKDFPVVWERGETTFMLRHRAPIAREKSPVDASGSARELTRASIVAVERAGAR